MLFLPLLILRLLLAIVLGGAIGLEREFHEHRAGMRTNALVSLGSALFTIISAYGFLDLLGPGHVQVDPTRVASYIVAGIGFLGAGAIAVGRGGARGLTTAAAIWTVAAIGMACGVGFYWEAVAATVLTLAVLRLLRYLEYRLIPEQAQAILRVRLEPERLTGELLGQVYEICLKQGFTIKSIQTRQEENETILELTLQLTQVKDALPVLDTIRALQGVRASALDLHGVDQLKKS